MRKMLAQIVGLVIRIAAVVVVAYSVITLHTVYKLLSYASALTRTERAAVTDTRIMKEIKSNEAPLEDVIRTTILVVVKPDCGTCTDTVRSWVAAFHDSGFDSGALRVAVLGSADDLSEFKSKFRSDEDITWGWVAEPEAFVLRTGINVVPMSLIISPDRRVLAGFAGTPSRAKQVDTVQHLRTLDQRRTMLVERTAGTMTRIRSTEP